MFNFMRLYVSNCKYTSVSVRLSLYDTLPTVIIFLSDNLIYPYLVIFATFPTSCMIHQRFMQRIFCLYQGMLMFLPEIQDHTVDRKVGHKLIRACMLTRMNTVTYCSCRIFLFDFDRTAK